jgi:Tfp pilus assembly protein PilV
MYRERRINMKLKILFDNAGVGLMEVMVSMLVLAIGILGLAPLLVVSIEGNIISRDNDTTSGLIRKKVEFFEGLDSLPPIPYKEEERNLQGVYSRTTYITDNTVDTLVPEGVYQVDITVSWIDQQNLQRGSSYSTYILKK